MNPSGLASWDLRSRHFVITGASSGIGQSVALLFDHLGASLSMIDRNEPGLQTTLASCQSKEHRLFPFDLRNIEEIDGLVAQAVKRGGLVHGVVHCAGIQAVIPAKILNRGNWKDIFAVNTESGLALAKSLHSKKVYAGSYGAIVFISSIMGLAGSPGAIAYSMSKAALHGVTRSLALEFASRGIRVNCIAPGFVRTPLFEQTEKLWDDSQRQMVEASHPLGFGEPEDIANAVAFLCCDTGRWITGTVMVVDGGYLAQ